MFDSLYKGDRRCYPLNFTPPETFRHGEDELIAKLKSEKDDDGYDVEIYELRMPATFWKIKVLPTRNSIDELRPGFEISTGSGGDEMLSLVIRIAEQINDGMMGFRSTDQE